MSFNKLFEYLAAARPVVFACESAYDPVAIAGCGISLPPMDPDRLADAFLQIAAAGPEERSRMGRSGRDYVAREHDIEQLTATLAGLTESVSRRSS
jgi:glycosyltransferase involved in cell wall biosynthesis